MKVRYVGLFDAIELPSLQLTVERGAEVDIPDDVAAGLLEQVGNFEPVTSGRRATPAAAGEGSEP
jgi:hypothetical protein